MKKKLSISIIFFTLVNCAPLSSIEGLHSTAHLIPAPPHITDTETVENTTQDTPITLSITKLDMDESTDMDRAFSELYLAFFTQEEASKKFLSVEQLLYENSDTQLPIPLDTIQPNETVYICLVSGRPDIHGVVYRDQKKKCRSFSASELLRISKKGYELSLQDKPSRTPKLKLLIHTSTS